MRNQPFAASYPTVSEALPDLLRRLLAQPERPSRNGSMRELEHVSITIERPSERYITTPGRKASVAAQAAETMWVLAGRNDVPWLSKYLKRAADFSDDGGSTWAGAYGPRIRRWAFDGSVHGGPPLGAPNTFDQLAHVVELLRADPTTRRAVIALYDPSSDSMTAESGAKDVPCNNWLSFHPADDDRLDLNVGIRSNDVIWGWSGINTFEWSVLLDLVAALTGKTPGRITYNTTSLHLYSTHYAKANRILDLSERATGRIVPGPPRPLVEGLSIDTRISEIDDLLRQWFRIEAVLGDRATPSSVMARRIERFPAGEFRDWLHAIRYARAGGPSLHAISANRALQRAAINSPKLPELPELPERPDKFIAYAWEVAEVSKAARQGVWDETVDLSGEGATLPEWDTLEPENDYFDQELLRNQLRRAVAQTDEDRDLIDDYSEAIRETQRLVHEDDVETRSPGDSALALDLDADARKRHRHFELWGRYEHPGIDARPSERPKEFWRFAADLHAEKHLAYGPSWKKRGEMLGIMANIARKVDRLGSSGGGETSADTALDLLVYLIKYRIWLVEFAEAPYPSWLGLVDPEGRPTDDEKYVRRGLFALARRHFDQPLSWLDEEKQVNEIRSRFDALEPLVEEKRTDRGNYVDQLIGYAYPLAKRLYDIEYGIETETETETETRSERHATQFWNGYEGPEVSNR